MFRKIKHAAIASAAVTAAAFVLALNYNTFITAGGLYPGGVSGLAVLVIKLVRAGFGVTLPFGAVNLLLNTLPLYIGIRYVSRGVAAYSCLLILLFGVFTGILPTLSVTEDMLLIAVFGGIVDGAAVCICLNVGATSGGTDLISLFLSEKRGTDSFGIILAFNACVLTAAGFMSGWDKALYSIIFQYVCTMVINALYKRYRQSSFFIVTAEPERVCREIYAVSSHGATVLEGRGSRDQQSRSIVYSVVSSPQERRVMNAVRSADPSAFVNVIGTRRITGNFLLPPPDKPDFLP